MKVTLNNLKDPEITIIGDDGKAVGNIYLKGEASCLFLGDNIPKMFESLPKQKGIVLFEDGKRELSDKEIRELRERCVDIVKDKSQISELNSNAEKIFDFIVTGKAV